MTPKEIREQAERIASQRPITDTELLALLVAELAKGFDELLETLRMRLPELNDRV